MHNSGFKLPEEFSELLHGAVDWPSNDDLHLPPACDLFGFTSLQTRVENNDRVVQYGYGASSQLMRGAAPTMLLSVEFLGWFDECCVRVSAEFEGRLVDGKADGRWVSSSRTAIGLDEEEHQRLSKVIVARRAHAASKARVEPSELRADAAALEEAIAAIENLK